MSIDDLLKSMNVPALECSSCEWDKENHCIIFFDDNGKIVGYYFGDPKDLLDVLGSSINEVK